MNFVLSKENGCAAFENLNEQSSLYQLNIDNNIMIILLPIQLFISRVHDSLNCNVFNLYYDNFNLIYLQSMDAIIEFISKMLTFPFNKS